MVFHTSSYNTNEDPLTEETILRNISQRQTRKGQCCQRADGFTVIAICFFVLTAAITFALVIQINYGSAEVTPHGAVASDERLCSEIGITVMRDGGSAADAVVATLLCLSVTHAHLVGPGGGGVILVHDHRLNKSSVIDFLPTLPRAMVNRSDSGGVEEGKHIGVPGFLKGLELLHLKYGKLPWRRLFRESIILARYGFPVSKQLGLVLQTENLARGSVPFLNAFLPRGLKLVQSQNATKEKYAKFLEQIANEGTDAFYKTLFQKEVLRTLSDSGSLIDESDLISYEAMERDCLLTNINNMSVITSGFTTGGLELVAGLEHLATYSVTHWTSLPELYEYFVRSFEFGSKVSSVATSLLRMENITALLSSEVLEALVNATAEPLFPQIPNVGASQVSAIDTFDLYVSAVVGLGSTFGSRIMTPHEILFNNHFFDAFPVFPQKETSDNFQVPQMGNGEQKAHTSYTPVIIMDTHQVCGSRYVLSAGDSSAALQVAAQLLFRHLEMTAAIAEPRVRLVRDGVIAVNDLVEKQKLQGTVRNYLSNLNYTFVPMYPPYPGVNGVAKMLDVLVSHSDPRAGGVAARLSKDQTVPTEVTSSGFSDLNHAKSDYLESSNYSSMLT